ncbi:MAG: bifunctional glutamate N-acetyltransferase/amino-acid acetyltransferase ArgJ [Pararhodobacter sp.]|nr:bifunctional glutamate N-acetyltransferase/amino-acid acetyltransferase ArgJ [Pararhodobacter sp.]
MGNKARKQKARTLKWKARAKALRARLEAAGGKAGAPQAGPTISPLAPQGGFPQLPEIAGASFATAATGLRYKGRPDVMLARLEPGTVIAGTFTRSQTRAAPVLDCQAKLAADDNSPGETGAAILVNAGNANAFTGAVGRESVQALCAALATRLGLPESRIFTASTGVIGERLPHERIVEHLDTLANSLAPGDIAQAAAAIMTTDTFPKGAGAEIEIGGETVRISGIAKGSGMIAPDMATMLVFIFTDANLPQPLLQDMTARLTEKSFNAITVDSDTSTSDTLIVAATGQSRAPAIDNSASSEAAAFEAALGGVMLDLAHQVVRDGEGATKFVEITVTGAQHDADAKRCALAIANSPLVKTAIAGEDPNWGRIVMAVGKSGALADRDRLAIRFGAIPVATAGMVDPDYREEDGAGYMRRQELEIGVDLGLGQGRATVWTCDLTHRYIDINADYRS